MSGLSAPVLETLAHVAKELTVADGPWWLIGGAAAGLHGAEDGAIADIDIIMSPRDARKVLACLKVVPEQDGGTDLFRSEIFGRWSDPPLTVDLMGGMEVLAAGGWRRVEPATREASRVGGQLVYTPSRAELIDILRLFGRPKDLARARRLSEAG
ncbi:hypothetical protein [Microvirga lenta]|uniref:hypothetical protein n=1 Tax=Microvirga lenta TaxID=2881337 RepID=UPI001CFE18AF|nr:hypothetical protein [Microvirga lenta]MCB5173961.1 hypothetical protein [Microvirga lenta]